MTVDRIQLTSPWSLANGHSLTLTHVTQQSCLLLSIEVQPDAPALVVSEFSIHTTSLLTSDRPTPIALFCPLGVPIPWRERELLQLRIENRGDLCTIKVYLVVRTLITSVRDAPR